MSADGFIEIPDAVPADGMLLSLWRGLVPARPMNKREIIAYVARRHDLSVEDLTGPRRFTRLTLPRQEAMWMMRQVRRADGSARYSYPEIAVACGVTNHTTAMWGEQRHQERLDALRAEQEAA